MQTQHFIIEGKYLGSAPRPDGRAHSHAFLCFECGKQWASCPAEPPGPSVTNWVFHSVRCRACGAKHTLTVDTPGDIYQNWPDPGFTAAFPFAVLQWEFERRMDQLDKWNRIQAS